MKKRTTVMAFLAVIAIMAAVPVLAQTPPYPIESVGDLESNTSRTTAGLFGNDVDDFMDYHNYSNVLSDGAKWFGFVSGRNLGTDFPPIYAGDFGYATNISGIYLGAWFRGNFARRSGDGGVENIIESEWDEFNNDLLSKTETTEYEPKWLETANQIEFLVGVAGHGIRVGFFESLASDLNKGGDPVTKTDTRDGIVTVAGETVKYKNSAGLLKPYVGWGSSFNLLGMNIYPYANLGLFIWTDKEINNTDTYTEYFGVRSPNVTTSLKGHKKGYLMPDVKVGASLDLPSKGATNSSVSLSYNLQFGLFSNDYSDSGFSGKVKGDVDWDGSHSVYKDTSGNTVTTDTTTLIISERKEINNNIELGYTITGELIEDLKLGFSAGLPISFSSRSENNYSKSLSKTVTKYELDPGHEYVTEKEITTFTDGSDDTKTSTFGAGLRLNLGASYALIKDRFTVNAGISAMPVFFSRSKTTTIPDSTKEVETNKTTLNGTVTSNTKDVTLNTSLTDSVAVNTTWDIWNASLSCGFTFFFSPNIALDLGLYSGFGGDQIFNQVNVLFTLKY